MTSLFRKTLLRGGRLAETGWVEPRLLDMAIGADGRIAEIGSDLPGEGCEIVDLGGRLVTPALVDMHQHLDKSHSVDEAPNPLGTLSGAGAAFGAYAEGLTSQAITRRARRTLEACLERGTVAIRSHANVDHQLRLRSVEALVALKQEYRERMHLDVVAFVTSSAARGDIAEARHLLEDALAAGADTVGGAPNLAPDPAAFIDMLMETAARHNRPIDLHIDETLDPSARCLEHLAKRTSQMGLWGRVVAGHCSSLAAIDDKVAGEIMAQVLEAGIGIVTLPAANLFLQARNSYRLPARGLTRVVELMRLGVPTATASDNIQDAFVPVGSGDMLEMARWTILAGHLLADAPAVAFDMITRVPASMMGIETAGLAVGDWANLLVTDAADVADLVRSGPLRRAVFYRGRHVAGPA